ncbi:MAG: TetR/AcrR family transcriptional regulator [Endozoicomonas sp.]
MSGQRKSVDRLKQAAVRLFVKKPGASLAEVAEEAGVGRATLHRHFASREILLLALQKECHDAIEKAFSEVFSRYVDYNREQLLEAIGVFVNLGSEYSFLGRDWELTDSSDISTKVSRQQLEWESYLYTMVKQQVLRSDLPIGWIKAGIDGLVMAAWQAIDEQELGAKQADRLTREAAERAFFLPEEGSH